MRSFLKLGEAVLQQFNSNLPILIIETWNRGDPGGNTHLDGFMAIIEPDPETGRARITDEFATDTRVGLKRRGSSSFGWPKYSMTVEARDEEGNASRANHEGSGSRSLEEPSDRDAKKDQLPGC